MFTHPNQPSMELITKYSEKPMPQTQIHPKKKESTQQFQLTILLQSCNTQAIKNNIDNNITKKNSKPHYKAISLHRPCNKKPSNAYLSMSWKREKITSISWCVGSGLAGVKGVLMCRVRVGWRKTHLLRQLLTQFNLYKYLPSNKPKYTTCS